MIGDEDFDPKTKRLKPRLLDNMSVADLQNYIAQLRAEIARAEADIVKKDSHKSAADAFFKK
jgi:uncharacterized small protein (DUF1192 family)